MLINLPFLLFLPLRSNWIAICIFFCYCQSVCYLSGQESDRDQGRTMQHFCRGVLSIRPVQTMVKLELREHNLTFQLPSVGRPLLLTSPNPTNSKTMATTSIYIYICGACLLVIGVALKRIMKASQPAERGRESRGFVAKDRNVVFFPPNRSIDTGKRAVARNSGHVPGVTMASLVLIFDYFPGVNGRPSPSQSVRDVLNPPG